MEKYYCEHCRLLYDQEEFCKVCGTLASRKINIEVQAQSKTSKPPFGERPDGRD